MDTTNFTPCYDRTEHKRQLIDVLTSTKEAYATAVEDLAVAQATKRSAKRTINRIMAQLNEQRLIDDVVEGRVVLLDPVTMKTKTVKVV